MVAVLFIACKVRKTTVAQEKQKSTIGLISKRSLSVCDATDLPRLPLSHLRVCVHGCVCVYVGGGRDNTVLHYVAKERDRSIK